MNILKSIDGNSPTFSLAYLAYTARDARTNPLKRLPDDRIGENAFVVRFATRLLDAARSAMLAPLAFIIIVVIVVVVVSQSTSVCVCRARVHTLVT
jgi:hypothetical protein